MLLCKYNPNREGFFNLANMYNISRKLAKTIENKVIKYFKPVFLLVVIMVFSFPNASISQDLQVKPAGPVPEEAIKAYYDGPTLPEIPLRSARTIMYIPVSAYNSLPEQTDDTPFITASGTRTRDGVVAANFLAIGTIVRFPEIFGDKEFIVEDRMNARYYYRADIWMEHYSDARQFGVKYLKMEIL